MGGLLKPADVAKLLNVSKSTVRRLADEGKLTRRDISARCIRYDQAEVEALAAGNQGAVCQSKKIRRARAATLSSSSSGANAYIADALAARERRKPKRSRSSSVVRSLRLVT